VAHLIKTARTCDQEKALARPFTKCDFRSDTSDETENSEYLQKKHFEIEGKSKGDDTEDFPDDAQARSRRTKGPVLFILNFPDPKRLGLS
jgi:hypothetical protein